MSTPKKKSLPSTKLPPLLPIISESSEDTHHQLHDEELAAEMQLRMVRAQKLVVEGSLPGYE